MIDIRNIYFPADREWPNGFEVGSTIIITGYYLSINILWVSGIFYLQFFPILERCWSHFRKINIRIPIYGSFDEACSCIKLDIISCRDSCLITQKINRLISFIRTQFYKSICRWCFDSLKHREP